MAALRVFTTTLTILVTATSIGWADPMPLYNGDFSTAINIGKDSNHGNWLATVTLAGGDASIEQFGGDIVFKMGTGVADGTVVQLEQSVSLDPGWYRLSFVFSAELPAAESDYFRVFAGEAEAVLATNHYADVSIVNQPGSFDFYTSASDVLLGFRLVREGGGTVGTLATLDFVELSAVPVPGAVLLSSVGLGYAGLRLRRRTGSYPCSL